MKSVIIEATVALGFVALVVYLFARLSTVVA